MLKYFKCPIAALPILAFLVPVVDAQAADPPITTVARWHDRLCPRDLTPQVTSPLYGYYPTRWRLMPADLVLLEEIPPPAGPIKKGVVPPKGGVIPPAGKSPVRLNDPTRFGSPYGTPIESIDLRRVMPVKAEQR